MLSKRIFPRILTILLLAIAGAGSAADAPREAPDFSAPDLAGEMRTLSDYRGRIVILNFWATWCLECVKEIPSLNAFTETHKTVVVLGIASERSPDAVRKFQTSLPMNYPVIVDGTGDIFVTKYLVRALPTTLVVDKRGRIAERLIGVVDFQSREFQEKIQRLNNAN